jgi:hypothetical protein
MRWQQGSTGDTGPVAPTPDRHIQIRRVLSRVPKKIFTHLQLNKETKTMNTYEILAQKNKIPKQILSELFEEESPWTKKDEAFVWVEHKDINNGKVGRHKLIKRVWLEQHKYSVGISDTRPRFITIELHDENMIYWDDMLDKCGFDDGSTEPVEARKVRPLYVKTVNAFAEALKSKHRAFAYDRGGVHNGCMICFTTAEQAEGKDLESGSFEPETFLYDRDTDEAMSRAIEEANELDLDGCVEVTVKVNNDTLKGIEEAIQKVIDKLIKRLGEIKREN